MTRAYIVPSESVGEGHPDKVADNISDAILDALLAGDPRSRVAGETLVNTGMAVISGEITSAATVDYTQVVRDTIVDTYGGVGRHGGGAFSGKDPSKVDRSAAYAARYLAKNVVAAGLAYKCEVQLAYAIGIAEPVSVHVETFGTAKIDEGKIEALIREHFDLRPKGIIQMLDLLRPIYRKMAANGHFGRDEPEFTWERIDKAERLGITAGL